MKNEYPITRHDPGKLPDVPDHFGISESAWFWKLSSWLKVRTAINATSEHVEDVAELLAMHEDPELSETDRDLALFNATQKLKNAGFSKVDFEHLGIPVDRLQ